MTKPKREFKKGKQREREREDGIKKLECYEVIALGRQEPSDECGGNEMKQDCVHI